MLMGIFQVTAGAPHEPGVFLPAWVMATIGTLILLLITLIGALTSRHMSVFNAMLEDQKKVSRDLLEDQKEVFKELLGAINYFREWVTSDYLSKSEFEIHQRAFHADLKHTREIIRRDQDSMVKHIQEIANNFKDTMNAHKAECRGHIPRED